VKNAHNVLASIRYTPKIFTTRGLARPGAGWRTNGKSFRRVEGKDATEGALVRTEGFDRSTQRGVFGAGSISSMSSAICRCLPVSKNTK